MRNIKTIKLFPVSASKEISFVLKNCNDINYYIEQRKKELIDRINYSTAAWLRGRSENSNSMEDILILYENDRIIKRFKKWQKVINRLLNDLSNEEVPIEYYLIKYRYMEKMSDEYIIDKLQLNSIYELRNLIVNIKNKIYEYALEENLYKEVISYE